MHLDLNLDFWLDGGVHSVGQRSPGEQRLNTQTLNWRHRFTWGGRQAKRSWVWETSSKWGWWGWERSRLVGRELPCLWNRRRRRMRRGGWWGLFCKAKELCVQDSATGGHFSCFSCFCHHFCPNRHKWYLIDWLQFQIFFIHLYSILRAQTLLLISPYLGSLVIAHQKNS